jgi:hypothetical protein
MTKREESNEGGDYELLPEKRFDKLEAQVNEILKNPLVRKETAHEFHEVLLSTNVSIKALADILKKISEDTSLEQKEEDYVKNQLKPLTLAIKEIKEQNETIATGMVNIIDRLNELQKEIVGIKQTHGHTQQQYYQMQPQENEPVDSNNNNNLPPLQGGPMPPEVENNTEEMQDFSTEPFNPQPLNGIPPMEENGMKKKFKLF